MKSHKIEHNEKAFGRKEFGSHDQGEGHSQGSEIKSSLCDNLKPTVTEANFIKHHTILYSQTQGQGNTLGSAGTLIPTLKVKVTVRGGRSIVKLCPHEYSFTY